jgi:hypothetical protein
MDSQSKEDIIKLELELKNIREEKYKGIITRANAKWKLNVSIICKLTKRIYKSILLEKAVCL